MKKYLFTCIVISVFFGKADAQHTYTITNWLDNKKAAISVTFDDGCHPQFGTALPIINARNIKGTFYIITDLNYNCVPSDWNFDYNSYWNTIRDAANDGHEIGCHTVTHPDLNLSSVNVYNELKNSLDAINSNVTTQKCLTLAYPQGKGSNNPGVRSIAHNFYIGARAAGVNPSGYDVANDYTNPFFQDYFYQVECFEVNDTVTIQYFSSIINGAIQNSGWFIPMYHNLNTAAALSVTSANFTSQMDAVSNKAAVAWIAPFVEVLKYTKERIAASIVKTSKSTSNMMVLSLTDTLPDAIFNHPLTITVDNMSRNVVSVTQGTHNLSFNQKNSILTFNAIPDAGDIEISYNNVVASDPAYTSFSNGWSVYPNPSSGTLSISYTLKEENNISLAIYHPDGSLIKTLINSSFQQGDYNVSVNTHDMQAGFYFCKFTCGSFIDTKKIVVIK